MLLIFNLEEIVLICKLINYNDGYPMLIIIIKNKRYALACEKNLLI